MRTFWGTLAAGVTSLAASACTDANDDGCGVDFVPEAGATGAPTQEHAGGQGGGAGAFSCDCGEDVNHTQIPLECALRTDLRDDIAYYGEPFGGTPYYALLGTCANGYRTLYYSQGGERSVQRTYDARGDMVYQRFVGYGFHVPEACGFDDSSAFGDHTVGEERAEDCEECLLATDDPDAGGAGSDEPSPYPRDTRPCTLSEEAP